MTNEFQNPDDVVIEWDNVIEIELEDHDYSLYYYPKHELWVAEDMEDSEDDGIILEDHQYSAFSESDSAELQDGWVLTREQFEQYKQLIK